MKDIDELLTALPIRDIRVRSGSYGNCGGVLFLTVDVEAGGTGGVEVVSDGADLPDWFADFPDDAVQCMERITAGAREAFDDRFAVEPDVRIVVRRAKYNEVDIIMSIGPRAGKLVVAEAIGRAKLLAGLAAHEPFDPVPPRTGGWETRLRVRLGLTYEGSLLELDLKPTSDGPHGMILGAGGSGRLTAVRGILSGLVRSHSPEELNLLLLDAAVGAGFEWFAGLPHTRGVVNDLAGFRSRMDWWECESYTELQVRRKLLEDNGFATHAEYERARAGGRNLAPLPSLLIVIEGFSDIFAAGTSPDFIATLIQIGRLGRTVGVHMLLTASYLGEGELRGLDGFLHYRIGLRTDNVTQSRVVIGVNDCVDLPGEPGHAYLRVGTEMMTRFRFGQVIEG